MLDYDSAEDEGLADGFQPSVKVSCSGGTMRIRVDTLKPFKGIIHAGTNRTEEGCFTLGNDGLKTYLNIDLTQRNGTAQVTKIDQKRPEMTTFGHPDD